MYIAIKTDAEVAELTLLESSGHTLDSDRWEAGRRLSGELLDHIQRLIKKQPDEQLKGIVVFRGPGSFTGLRIGATVANALAYAQELPIVGTHGKDWLAEGCRQLQAGENDIQVIPHYGAPANITRPGNQA